LTYSFTVREPEKAVVALEWEDLAVPITITVPNAKELYVQDLRKELRTNLGFFASNWRMAADYCLQNKVDLPEALAWARKAVSDPNFGEENFQNLTTLWRAELANDLSADAAKTLDKALASPTANPIQIHLLGRQLLGEGKKAEAMKIFELNAKRFPNQWPVNVGLMRGYAALGDTKKALKYAKLALPQAPDPLNKKNLENMIKLLEEGKNIN
jgi:tetratricopeptide (TPR) repeat protein